MNRSPQLLTKLENIVGEIRRRRIDLANADLQNVLAKADDLIKNCRKIFRGRQSLDCHTWNTMRAMVHNLNQMNRS